MHDEIRVAKRQQEMKSFIFDDSKRNNSKNKGNRTLIGNTDNFFPETLTTHRYWLVVANKIILSRWQKVKPWRVNEALLGCSPVITTNVVSLINVVTDKVLLCKFEITLKFLTDMRSLIEVHRYFGLKEEEINRREDNQDENDCLQDDCGRHCHDWFSGWNKWHGIYVLQEPRYM